MSKSRFTTTDVKSMVNDLRPILLGHRVSNIYDITDKTYIFKFAIPGKTDKFVLLLESGIRFHTTQFGRDKSELPSPFAMKLRKFIRTKRLENIRQLNNDRVVDFTFGSGESTNHIILELYANGNIILTDNNFEILALLRSHQFEDDIAIKVGEVYPVAITTGIETLPTGTIFGFTSSSTPESVFSWAQMKETEFLEWHRKASEDKETEQEQKKNNTNGKKNFNSGGGGGAKKDKVKQMTLRQLLLSKDSGVSSLGGEILDHCLLSAGYSPSMKLDIFLKSQRSSLEPKKEKEGKEGKEVASGPGSLSQLISLLLDQGPALLSLFDAPAQPGFILSRPLPTSKSTAASASASSSSSTLTQEYFDFVPQLLKQHQPASPSPTAPSHTILQFPSFNEAVDEYFSQLDGQKLQKQALQAEETARKKVEKVQSEQRALLSSLSAQQLKMEKGAMLVEAHAEEVDKVCLVLNSAVGSGMSWEDVKEMVQTQKTAGNPLAMMIHKLKLDRNEVVLKLRNLLNIESDSEEEQEDGDEDDDDEEDSNDEEKESVKVRKQNNKSSSNKSKKDTAEFIEVDIDLSLSAYANARKMFSQKRRAREKEERTEEAARKAIQSVEIQAQKTLSSQNIKKKLTAVRKIHWFERFNWFLSSDGHLILSGRDAVQNEALVKKHLKPWDAYVHADIPGAACCIVKAKKITTFSSSSSIEDGLPTPETETDSDISKQVLGVSALQQAGAMSVCRSGAWKAKIVTSAWWVWGSQVTKKTPSGEYLSTGSFMVYGRKNPLPPTSSLEMGFGIMFRLEDGSVKQHQLRELEKEKERSEREERLGVGSGSGAGGEGRLGRKGLFIEWEGGADANNTTGGGGGGGMGGNRKSNKVGGDEKEVEGEDTQSEEIVHDKYGLGVAGISRLNEGDDQQVSIVSSIVPSLPSSSSSSNPYKYQQKQHNKKDNTNNTNNEKGKQMKVDLKKESKEEQNTIQEDEEEEVQEDENDDDENEENGEEEDDEDDDDNYQEQLNKFYGTNHNNNNANKTIKGKDSNTPPSSNQQKSQKQQQQQQQNNQNKSKQASPPPVEETKKKTKNINKKKARRYEEQDEEDKELAMLALGHLKLEKKQETKEKKGNQKTKKSDSKNIKNKETLVSHVAAPSSSMTSQSSTSSSSLSTSNSSSLSLPVIDKKEIDPADEENENDNEEESHSTETSHDSEINAEKKQERVLARWLAPVPLDKSAIREALKELVEGGFVVCSELDEQELRSLSTFSEKDGLKILQQFKEKLIQNSGPGSGSGQGFRGNKNALFAGLLRDTALKNQSNKGLSTSIATSSSSSSSTVNRSETKNEEKLEKIESPSDSESEDDEKNEEDDESEEAHLEDNDEKDVERDEEEEVRAILQEEGVLDEEEGKQADELSKLTATPVPSDVLLFAIPVCGPFASMQHFKYKVKLTPGPMKKGKAVKQAVEMFTRGTNSSSSSSLLDPSSTTNETQGLANERNLIKLLTDPEMVAIMIGDVKVSTPGLQQMKQQLKNAKKTQKIQSLKTGNELAPSLSANKSNKKK